MRCINQGHQLSSPTIIRLILCVFLVLPWTAFSAEQKDNTPAPPSNAKDTSNTPPELPLNEMRMFTDVFSHIRSSYVKDIDDKTLLENAIKGMLSGLDPHSTYLDQSSFNDLQVNTTGEFGGLGIEVGMENGFVKVVAPIDDTPAKEAGIEAGDLIIKLDEKPVKGMTLNEAVKLMRGPKGSDIVLTIIREGESQPLEITVVRNTIKVRSVRWLTLEPGYGYLRVAQFQVNTGPDLEKAIDGLTKEHPSLKGLVLDLRNNPGGVLQASVDVASVFLDGGLVVYTEGKIANSQLKYSAKPGDKTDGAKLVVLLNDGSASASEIVAGALQDHGRAIIMGTDSFGKGSVQTILPLAKDRAIKLTTALYYTPNGRSIQAQGISPDIIVEPATITALKRPSGRITEADLSGHLDNTNGNADQSAEKKDGTSKQISKSILNKDNQLYMALTVLKSLHVATANSNKEAAP